MLALTSSKECWLQGVLALRSAGSKECWLSEVLALSSAGPKECWVYRVLATGDSWVELSVPKEGPLE